MDNTEQDRKVRLAQEAFYRLGGMKHAGFDRSELPQIPYDKEDYVIDSLGLKQSRAFARDIKSAQSQIKKSKVINKMDTGQETRKYMVSRDGYLIDGHHSWATLLPNNDIINIYKSQDHDIDEIVGILTGEMGFGSKSINESVEVKDLPENEPCTDCEETATPEYCSATYQRILKITRGVATVDLNRAKSLFGFMGKRYNESVKDFCKRTDINTLKRLAFELGNLNQA